jgi:hypothetical protein
MHTTSRDLDSDADLVPQLDKMPYPDPHFRIKINADPKPCVHSKYFLLIFRTVDFFNGQ